MKYNIFLLKKSTFVVVTQKVAQCGCYFAGRIIGYCQVFEVGIVYVCGIIAVFTYSISRAFNTKIIEMISTTDLKSCEK